MQNTARKKDIREPMHSSLFERDSYGKPIIPLDDIGIYAFGYLIRQTENLILDLFSKGLLSGTTHTCLGQEICQMSVVRALCHPDDVVLSNHRNHGHFLTYSGDPLGLVAEIMGRAAGVCGGYGGSQHIAFRHFHSNGVQAGMTAIGVGLSKALQFRNSDAVVAIFVGDGTLGEGLLYEAMNLSSIEGVSVLFVVENNGIAQTTDTSATIGGRIIDRGSAFGLQTWELDDDSPDFVGRVEKVVEQMRSGQGAGFLTINTRRLGPHSKGDDLRSEKEKELIKARDPLAAIGKRIDESPRIRIETEVNALIKNIGALAKQSPESTLVPVPTTIFTETGQGEQRTVCSFKPKSKENIRSQLNRALDYLLETDNRTILLGEDLHDPYGGAFKVTESLSARYTDRVISTPISEAGITGYAIGLAMAGFRPILEIMFADFLTLCMDQIFNHAVKFPGMFSDCKIPLVIRTPCGGRRGYGPTHSQSLENLLVSVPGLTVVYPSHRHNVGEILIHSVMDWDYPVLFLEHKLLYGELNHSLDYEPLEIEESDVASDLFPTLVSRRSEPDITIISFGGMLVEVERAVEHLEKEEELSVEIVAPSLLSPLALLSLHNYLLDRPMIMVAEESHSTYGVSAEILAMFAEAGYSGRLIRLGTNSIPIASARSMERQIIPDSQAIIEKVMSLF